MKILFLDVDGVLNNRDSLNGDAPHLGDAHISAWVVGIAQMELLKEIVDRTQCKIVLSSTWRLYMDGLVWLNRFFVKTGIDHKIIISQTPNLSGDGRSGNIPERNVEIAAWLKDNTVDNFVIVDDDPDACIDGHFVQTVFTDGLTREKADEIIRMLGSEA